MHTIYSIGRYVTTLGWRGISLGKLILWFILKDKGINEQKIIGLNFFHQQKGIL